MKYIIFGAIFLVGFLFLNKNFESVTPKKNQKLDLTDLRQKVNQSINKNLKLSTAEKSFQNFQEKSIKLKAEVEGVGSQEESFESKAPEESSGFDSNNNVGIESHLRLEEHQSSSHSPDEWAEFVKNAKADGWDVFVDTDGEIRVRERSPSGGF